MLLSIIKGLLGFKGIAEQLATAYAAKTNAATEQERIAADLRIKTLEAKANVQIAEAAAGSRINSYIRAAIALPIAILLWKVFVFDKAAGQWTGGRTDQLSDELWQVVTVVIGFYFVHETARMIFRR